MPWTRNRASSSFSASSSKTRMNSSPMILRLRSGSSTPASRSRKRSSASTCDQLCAEPVAECLDDLRRLVLSHHPVVDEHAGELIADRLVDERGRGRRVDSAAEPADHPGVADLGADALDLVVDHRGRRPALLAAGDVAQEALQDLGAVRACARPRGGTGSRRSPARRSRRRRPASRGWRRGPSKPGGGSKTRVAVAHPALLLGGKAGEQRAAPVGERELGAAELARLGPLDAPAETWTIACMP